MLFLPAFHHRPGALANAGASFDFARKKGPTEMKSNFCEPAQRLHCSLTPDCTRTCPEVTLLPFRFYPGAGDGIVTCQGAISFRNPQGEPARMPAITTQFRRNALVWPRPMTMDIAWYRSYRSRTVSPESRILSNLHTAISRPDAHIPRLGQDILRTYQSASTVIDVVC